MMTEILTWPGGELHLDRCRVMGIVNITPDSFSDGGKFLDPSKAIARAFELKDEGADLIDIGAESTRPGAQGVSEDEERRRLWPVLTALSKAGFSLPISLDCAKPRIVEEGLTEGLIQIVNDVEGLRNPEMVKVVRAHRVPVILMHMFGSPRMMQQDFRYGDVVKELIEFFRGRIAEVGISRNVVIDPGIGFGKSVEHNLQILRRLREFEVLGFPILIGASRKSFIGKILNVEAHERLEGSLAAAAVAVMNGARLLRVHDVKPTVRVVRMVEAVCASTHDTGKH